MLGGGQRERRSSKIADLFTPLPPCGVGTKQAGSPGAAKTGRASSHATPKLCRQKPLPAQEPYRAELSRERRSHRATICSIRCAFRVSSSSIYLKGRSVFLRSWPTHAEEASDESLRGFLYLPAYRHAHQTARALLPAAMNTHRRSRATEGTRLAALGPNEASVSW